MCLCKQHFFSSGCPTDIERTMLQLLDDSLHEYVLILDSDVLHSSALGIQSVSLMVFRLAFELSIYMCHNSHNRNSEIFLVNVEH